ncbi:MAG: hypothetical protein BroJett011_30260 [Chloroflexota bacterium]|nr:MAG: hypothetical protein BroJett011_30260 [Chloroflexota bacterium]
MEDWRNGRLDWISKPFFQPSNLPTFQPSMFKSLPFALGLFLFSIYLLTFSGKFHVMDELAVFTAGHNLAQYQRADINPLIWTNHWTPNPPGIWGSDGNLYTKKPPGISFITAPLIGLGHALPGLNAVHTGLLTNAAITALTASLLFIWLIDLGFTSPVVALTTLGYGLCTIAWVYARMFWESSLLAFFFLAAVWAAYRATHLAQPQQRWLWLLLCGLAIAVSLTLRFEAVIALGLIGLYLTMERGGEETRSRGAEEQGSENVHASRITYHASRITLYLAPSLLIGLGLLYFNYLRFGSFIETGYSQEILFKEPWVGAYGLLFSPGRGLFIYSPLLLLLFWGLRPARRRLPPFYFWLIVVLCLGYWLFYGSWFAWGGAWGWGPRFLLPILPLLMVFVAETVVRGGEEAKRRGIEEQGSGGAEEQGSENAQLPRTRATPPLGTHHVSRSTQHASRITLYALIVLSLIVNLLGILVDFNEHFLRLGANDNFVFNWAAFPPLAHWQILQEGLVDLIWLQPSPAGLQIQWPVLLPALALLGLATTNLVVSYREEIRNEKLENIMQDVGRRTQDARRFMFHALRFTPHVSAFILLFLTIALTYLMMRNTAGVTLANDQARFDLPLLEQLNRTARPGDVLLLPMPPFADVQEISTRLMAYLRRPLPTYAWIESDPRAIQPAEREHVWRAVEAEAQRVWLFERWLAQGDPPTVTAIHLNQHAFPLQEQWVEQSGRLTLYALAQTPPPAPTPLNVSFQGGLTLLDFTGVGDTLVPGGVLKLRLTWQVPAAADLAGQSLPPDSVIVFVQLLSKTGGQKVAQVDRLLVDLQNFKQSPLLPGQTIQQGYGLQLPADLPSGTYSLMVGLYQAGNGQRLLRTDGSPDDFVYLPMNVVIPLQQ